METYKFSEYSEFSELVDTMETYKFSEYSECSELVDTMETYGGAILWALYGGSRQAPVLPLRHLHTAGSSPALTVP